MDVINIDSQYFPFYKLWYIYNYIHLPRWFICFRYLVFFFAMIRFPIFLWQLSPRFQLQHTRLVWECIVLLHWSFEIVKILGKQKSYCLHFCKLYNKHKRQVYMYLFVVYIFDSNKSKVYLKILMFKIMHAYCLIIQFLQWCKTSI